MSFFKNLSVGEYARIENILKKMEANKEISPGEWKINNDLTVDLMVGHLIVNQDFEKLPFKINKVGGIFSIWGCDNLKTIDGFPNHIDDDLVIINCKKLKIDIQHLPSYIGGDLLIRGCNLRLSKSEIRKHIKVKKIFLKK